MKKIAKIVSVLHFYDFIICRLGGGAFKVFLDEKLYSEDLVTDLF